MAKYDDSRKNSNEIVTDIYFHIRRIFLDFLFIKSSAADSTLLKNSLLAQLVLSKPLKVITVHWKALLAGKLELHNDGTCKENYGLSSGGHIIRDSASSFVPANSNNYSLGTSLRSKVSLLDGLKLCLDLNVDNIEVNLDNQVIVNIFLDPNQLHEASILAFCSLTID
ncbi:hypothetical protein ACH5RR_041051 [Cinchona calisaya]|uniref:RNase H type-1 domain-containing protein n=1 Tax=Cinchona calisaya TaxID=153742 RepID=A0ABD2XYG0_9GENT